MQTDTSLTWADKLALAASFGLIVAYTFDSVRGLLGGLLDEVFGIIAMPLPFLAALLVFAVLTAFLSTTIRGVMTDPETQQAANERMAELQQKIGPGVDGADKLSQEERIEYQKQSMAAQMTIIRMQFRPLGWTLLLSLPVFLWLSWKVELATGAAAVAPSVVIPLVGEATWATSLVGPFQVWIFLYVLMSAAFAQLFLKTIGWTRPTPTDD